METKITREQVLETMANANQVEGFDPRLVTTCYKDADGNARMYLQAEPAMMWFRLKHPGGRLEQIVYRANDMMATVEGRVIDETGTCWRTLLPPAITAMTSSGKITFRTLVLPQFARLSATVDSEPLPMRSISKELRYAMKQRNSRMLLLTMVWKPRFLSRLSRKKLLKLKRRLQRGLVRQPKTGTAERSCTG